MGKSEYSKSLAQRLKTIAKMHNIDCSEFAEKCKIKEDRMRRLMNGNGKMSVTEALDIAEAFDVSMDYIMGIYPYPLPTPHNEKEAEVYFAIGKMSEDELEKFKAALEADIERRKS